LEYEPYASRLARNTAAVQTTVMAEEGPGGASRSSEDKEWVLYKVSKETEKEEVAMNKDECDVKTEGGAKQLTCLGECAVPNRGREEHDRNVALPSNTVLYHVYNRLDLGYIWEA
jgi:hypothetical protein